MMKYFRVRSVRRLNKDYKVEDIQLLDHVPKQDCSNYVSVIIGNNGTGKSTLLAGIAQNLRRDLRRDKNKSVNPFDVVSVECDSSRSVEHVSLEYRYHQNFNLKPNKIVCLSVSNFDKFNASRRPYRSIGRLDANRTDHYEYFGPKRGGVGASFRGLVSQAAEQILARWVAGQYSNVNLHRIFSLLGFYPEIRITYEANFRYNIISGARKYTYDEFTEALRKNVKEKRSFSAKKISDEEVSRIRKALIILDEHTDIRYERKLEFFLDRSLHCVSHDKDVIDSLNVLRECGLVSFPDLYFMEEKGQVIELNNVSSGQMSILASFICIASSIEDNSLIMIDEPEISLHPIWQREYVNLMLDAFSSYHGCHFILATHSPLIVSDLSSEFSSIVSVDGNRRQLLDVDELSEKSSDYLLVNAFSVPTKNNLYLQELLIELLALAAEGETGSFKFKNGVETLQRNYGGFEEDNPVLPVVKGLVELYRGGLGNGS